ncbi:chorismate-binding protein [Pontibacter cellulosilyticus]|uniref:isochorismate synthase n=1 Tax=Pontibacter cellulosilyticus TaxID=1720253 RepID=A0A923N2P1_9BACT|nr:chorismate-binding protein [Pontibacter cellulosilyticus]MBC5991303.1 chorismate-binding protein [Pontibacter cellulosilyticus]
MGEETRQYTLENLFRAAIAQNRAVAVWRLPLTEQVLACVSLQQSNSIGQPELEQSPFGFLFCPFHTTEQEQQLFIKADLYFDGATGHIAPAADAPAEAVQAFMDALQSMDTSEVNWYSSEIAQTSYQTEVGFKGAVEKAIAAITAEEMEKVVLSRNYSQKLPANFSPVAAFEAMLQAYPNAFVSLVSVPGAGTWMGASPEVLVSVNEDRIFKTVALAGTQPAVEKVGDAIWRQKEIEEQGMVERYILNCFKSLRLREYTEIGPRTVIAGNLMHLRTDFKVDLKEVDFPTLGTDMLRLLHPTSAVCGLPKEPALQFILAYEGYNRSYYSGYLGPVNSPVGTHVFVNLRCMQVRDQEIILYAGAGITGESNPEKEWQETQHKMQTMRRILVNFE